MLSTAYLPAYPDTGSILLAYSDTGAVLPAYPDTGARRPMPQCAARVAVHLAPSRIVHYAV